ncbi:MULTISPECIES: polysaccharide deacetylase family protein [Arenibacter]|uniref:polysaccharide deacetylase family protein n=1 Tax=Arenibacter TaxID=178469 RepID=UPI000A387A82|nr:MULTISPECIES: polysaccharide deacetylase family protein [Arenibacter]
MLLIYTHKITSRFRYITKHLFTNILGIEVSFTTKVEDFIKHAGPKITYTKQPLQNEFFLRSNDLLFEQGINDLQIHVSDWEGVPCFFAAGERSNLPFDIFAASFYLLSRYEEYLPHVKDIHGRFPPKDSLAYQNNFLQIPVVDIWALRLLEGLKEKFPELEYKPRSYRFNPIIDVTTSHCFLHRGLVRGISGFLLDLVSLRLRRVVDRISVLMKLKRDPYDNFFELIELHKQYNAKGRFFFQFAEYSTYDKNVSPSNNKFKYLIKSVADYEVVSLCCSYSSFNNKTLLMEEKKNLSNVIHRPINSSRMRFNRVDIPETYRNLVDAGFTNDYTMGYTHESGFRAGSCTPFYFYDILLEVQQPIEIHPFALHDYSLLTTNSKEEALKVVASLALEVKKVNGTFVTIFSNELLGGEAKLNWKELYRNILKKVYVQ